MCKKEVVITHWGSQVIMLAALPESNRQIEGESKERFTYKAGISDNYGGFSFVLPALWRVQLFFAPRSNMPPDREHTASRKQLAFEDSNDTP